MSDPLWRRVWRTLQKEGLGSLWLKSLDALGYRRLYLLRRPLAEPILDCPTTVPVAIGWLTNEELQDYLAFRPDASRHDMAQQLLQGDRCLVARHEDRIVGSMWGSSMRASTTPLLGRDLALAAGEAYQFDAYTLPEVRGMGIAAALSVAWLRHLRDEACTAAIRMTFPWNVAALRSHAKAGYRGVAVVRCFRLGSRRYVFPRERFLP
jgi:GNAT superfamily N-acetyltransferase